ncbi:hypothetical protein GF382_03250, partial [Candidatus Falkowbacteria bacterium]|nr:hypothetical protein [Candidatus Falkowbacteria bacterium]
MQEQNTNIEKYIADLNSDNSRKTFKFRLSWSFIAAVVFYLFIGAGLATLFKHSIEASMGETAKVVFYSRNARIAPEIKESEESSSKGWSLADQVIGEPEVARSGDESSFGAENSAFYRWGENSLFIKDFATRQFLGQEIVEAKEKAKQKKGQDNVAEEIEDWIADEDVVAGSEDKSEDEELGTSTDMIEPALEEDENLEEQEDISQIQTENEVEDSQEDIKTEDAKPEDKQEETASSSDLSLFDKALGFFEAREVVAQEEADERDLIFGEFRQAKIKLSMAVITSFIKTDIEELKEEKEKINEQSGVDPS